MLGLIIVTKSHLVYLEKGIADGRCNSTVSLSKLLAVKKNHGGYELVLTYFSWPPVVITVS